MYILVKLKTKFPLNKPFNVRSSRTNTPVAPSVGPKVCVFYIFQRRDVVSQIHFGQSVRNKGSQIKLSLTNDKLSFIKVCDAFTLCGLFNLWEVLSAPIITSHVRSAIKPRFKTMAFVPSPIASQPLTKIPVPRIQGWGLSWRTTSATLTSCGVCPPTTRATPRLPCPTTRVKQRPPDKVLFDQW